MYAGKLLLSMCLRGEGHDAASNNLLSPHLNAEDLIEFESPYMLSHDVFSSKAPRLHIAEGKHLMKAVVSRLEKIFHKNEEASRNGDSSSEFSSGPSDYEDSVEEHPPCHSFEEAMEMMQSRESEQEMPENLQGGILLDQVYLVFPSDLNKFLFASDSQFMRELVELQGTTDVQEGPWVWKSGDMSCLTRTMSYTKAATKLVKAVKATEQQTYIRANGREYAILVNVSTPDVPYGNTFNVELLYKLMPGPELPSGEDSCRLSISWAINFHQTTMMRGMIEGGVRQGMKESFDLFANLLGKNLKILDSTDVLDKDHVLATLETEQQSVWKLAVAYFCNFTVVSGAFMLLYVIVHILLCEPNKIQGLEFYGLELPDSFGELITCGILVMQLKRVYEMISHFAQARLHRGKTLIALFQIYVFTKSRSQHSYLSLTFCNCLRIHLYYPSVSTGSDHGVKGQGDGWVLTVALIEGVSLASFESVGLPDPYVVFTCNGKTTTSSVKLQTCDPQWNGKPFICSSIYIFCMII